jgi:hypothetical protein
LPLVYFAEKQLLAENETFKNPLQAFRKRNLNFAKKLILKIAAEFLWQFKTETKRKNLFLFGCFENSKIFGLKTLRIKLEEHLAKSGVALREIATTGNSGQAQLL